MLCHESELNYEFLHDLHHGQANDKETYIKKMSLSTLNGRLWGDLTIVYWISHYLQCPIYVWNKNNKHITVKVWNETNIGNTLCIVYGNNHFELANTCYQIIVYFDFQDKKMCETNNDGMKKKPNSIKKWSS